MASSVCTSECDDDDEGDSDTKDNVRATSLVSTKHLPKRQRQSGLL